MEHTILSIVPTMELPPIDMTTINFEDEINKKKGKPPRFGYKHIVNLTLNNSGVWNELDNGDRIWLLNIHCPSALSINMLFDKFWLPVGAKLYMYNKSTNYIIGGFTSQNNKGSKDNTKGFGTGLVYGDNITIEYYEPAVVKDEAIINLTGIIQGYRYIFPPNRTNKTEDTAMSMPCEINVNCPEGSNWQKEKTGVARVIIAGQFLCTGTLLNNTSNNASALFLTANHCLSMVNKSADGDADLSNWVFDWGFELPNCVDVRVNPTNFTTTGGATVLANKSDFDFGLLKLTESPLDAMPPFNAFFNGWDASGNNPNGAVGINHPRGDPKKISVCNNSLGLTGVSNNNGSLTLISGTNFWEVNPWSEGLTEGASSGSALFDIDNHKVIGQLFGGNSSCSCDSLGSNCSFDGLDVYGRVSASFSSDPDEKRQLKHWLDPNNTGITSLDGGFKDGCIPTLNITNSITTGAHYFQASDNITASCGIGPGTNVEMRAVNFIKLTAGFHANGDFFWAHIDNCQDKVVPASNKTNNAIPSTISVTTPPAAFSFSLFPNPASSMCTVQFAMVDDADVVITLHDMVGRQLAVIDHSHHDIGTSSVTFPTNHYASGMYLVNFTDGTHRTTQRLAIIGGN